jgi:hypothetical protein
MPTLLLHAGTSKAGSTAVQELAAANRGELSRHRIEYFPVLAGPNHTELAAAFCTQPRPVTEALGITDERARIRLRRRLAERIDKALTPDATWFASTEHLTGIVSRDEEIAACAEFLRRFFDTITVILVLRRADYWLPSSYTEAIRAGVSRPLDSSFVESRRRVLDHRSLATSWQSAFGEGRVVCVPLLESDKRSLHALPNRILGAAGVDVQQITWTTPLSRPSNPSISAQATAVLLAANPDLRTSALRPTTSRRRAVDYIAERWPGPAVRLTPEAQDALDRLGLSLTGIADTEFAAGHEWPAWCDEPPAQVESQPVLSSEDRAAALAELEIKGLLRRHGRRAPIAAKLKQSARPLRRLWHQHRPTSGRR